MKTLKYLLFFMVIGSAIGAPAKDYKYLSWNEVVMLVNGAPTTHDKVEGYKIYCSPTILSEPEVDAFTGQFDVPNLEGAGRIRIALAALQIDEGDNWCAATAWNYDASGKEQEGGLSAWLKVPKFQGRFQNGSVPVVLDGFRLEQ